MYVIFRCFFFLKAILILQSCNIDIPFSQTTQTICSLDLWIICISLSLFRFIDGSQWLLLTQLYICQWFALTAILITNHFGHFRNHIDRCLLLFQTPHEYRKRLLMHVWQHHSPTCQQYRTYPLSSERVKERDATAKAHCNKKLWSLFIKFIYWLWVLITFNGDGIEAAA